MALAVQLPDPETMTTEDVISTPEFQLLRDIITCLIDIEERLVDLETA